MALSLTWGGRADTDINFSEFFAGNHTVCVRFMLQWVNVYAGPMLAVHGRGTYFIGNDIRWHCPNHPYTVISVQIGSGLLEFEIPPGFKETWHHLAVVRKGMTVTVYLDGASQGALTLSSSHNPRGTLRLGRSDQIHQQFYGFLDDVGVFTAALTESKVVDLAQARTLTGVEQRLLAGFVFGDGPRTELPVRLKRPLDYVPGARNVVLSKNRNSNADRALLPLSLVSHMRLPFAQGKARVMQAFSGALTHHGYATFAYDLDFPEATSDTVIKASAPGVVSHVEEGYSDTSDALANYVTVEQASGEFCDYQHLRMNGSAVDAEQAVSYGSDLATVGMVHQALTNLGEHKHGTDPGHFVTIPLPFCNYEYSDNCGFTWQHAIRGYLKEGQLVRNPAPRSPIRYTVAWTPATTGEYQIYDVPYEEYRARYDELFPEGWRIHTLSIVVVQGVPLYTAVFRPDTSAETPIYGVPYQEYRALYDYLFPQGWRLKLLRRYVIGTSIRYTAFFVPGTGGEIPLYDKPYKEYRARYNELWPQGWRLRLLDVVGFMGKSSYTAIWEPSTAKEVQKDVATVQQFKEEYDRLWPDGWRLHHISTYKTSGERITAVWKQTNEPEIWIHGWEYADFRARYDVLWELGWRLKLLARSTV